MKKRNIAGYAFVAAVAVTGALLLERIQEGAPKAAEKAMGVDKRDEEKAPSPKPREEQRPLQEQILDYLAPKNLPPSQNNKVGNVTAPIRVTYSAPALPAPVKRSALAFSNQPQPQNIRASFSNAGSNEGLSVQLRNVAYALAAISYRGEEATPASP